MGLKLGFIGAGNMAGAIIEGVTGSRFIMPHEIGVFDIDSGKLGSFRQRGFRVFSGVAELCEDCDAIVIAVKPQNFTDVLPLVKAGISKSGAPAEKLLISIAAGITAENIKQAVGFDCKLVLAMPNTPLMLGCGATAISAESTVTQEEVRFIKSIFSCAGIAELIPQNRMREVIPVNGSSPAFFYYLAKILIDCAEKSGIDAETAKRLVAQTMAGSAKMLAESEKSPQELIDMVCSPGGTTLAAIKALDDNGFNKAVEAANAACVSRAYELAELNKSRQAAMPKQEIAEPVQVAAAPKQEITTPVTAPVAAAQTAATSQPVVVTSVPENKPDAPKPQEIPTVPKPVSAVLADERPKTGAPWYEEAVLYQIYTLGFCGAPFDNDGNTQSRIRKVIDWLPHIKKTGADTVFFNPLFESDSHGYDTRDYAKLDCRLGTNADLAEVCDSLHKAGLRVVLDGVFNHAGRGFWAFKDVQANRHNSPYKDWFYIDFNRNGPCNDGFWYEGWEGHFNLVKLNLDNPAVKEYLFDCVRGWISEFGIDGIRLDVAYMLNAGFMRELRTLVKSIKPDFFLIGEMIHGDYRRIVNPEMLDSCTNYMCHKGIYSSFNDRNMFEIAHSLRSQFGPEQWTTCKGMHLLSFVDNHDVNRIASVLRDEKHLMPAYGLMFGMPGIPCMYYGGEWGAKGDKANGGDAALRACFDKPSETELTGYIGRFSQIHRQNPALSHGKYRELYLTNAQLVFEREYSEMNSRVIVAINAGSDAHTTKTLPTSGKLFDLVNAKYIDFGGTITLPPYSAGFYRCD